VGLFLQPMVQSIVAMASAPSAVRIEDVVMLFLP
jgi:hypothetical protein